MPAHDRRRYSLGVGSRASDRGGIGLCDGPAGADAGAEEALAVIPGQPAGLNPESRDSGFDGSRRPGMTTAHVNTPTIAPIRQVVSVPETIDFKPSELISSRRSGAMVPRPPIMMPRLPTLAKPHIAYSMISRERESSASVPSFDRST